MAHGRLQLDATRQKRHTTKSSRFPSATFLASFSESPKPDNKAMLITKRTRSRVFSASSTTPSLRGSPCQK
eukprot:3595461-Pyramimonas_sp.AAC.1